MCVQPVERQQGPLDPKESAYPHFLPHTPCWPLSLLFPSEVCAFQNQNQAPLSA